MQARFLFRVQQPSTHSCPPPPPPPPRAKTPPPPPPLYRSAHPVSAHAAIAFDVLLQALQSPLGRRLDIGIDSYGSHWITVEIASAMTPTPPLKGNFPVAIA